MYNHVHHEYIIMCTMNYIIMCTTCYVSMPWNLLGFDKLQLISGIEEYTYAAVVVSRNIISLQSLIKVLDQTGSDSSEAVNKLHPSDGTACGDVAVLHRLVIGNYTHQVELVTTLLTFTMADINLTTSTGKTAFQLAVEVCIILSFYVVSILV